MNQDVLKNRCERFELWRQASGSLNSGLVSPGLAAWLLDISDTRVRFLVSVGRIESRVIAGARLLKLSSVYGYHETTCKKT